ncbi:MAG: hypothetical protein GTO55_03090 [Armatimonadetes bacterium]|nr:hypothetical protein [Armatimonadota bacterium]NIM23261.1 hypothetical protein [Armatimonadota bacterium]NIM67129.1 hypothetical protein [Armatimonadota bacterium]NIM75656.1 hypothetical protein [Armatimonadota bacterium]NIN05318.1 hypothetical protein [Armatimonadota bacterium]
MRPCLLFTMVIFLLSLLVINPQQVIGAEVEARSIDQELAKVAAEPGSGDTQRSFRFIVLGDSRAPWQLYTAVQDGEMDPFQPEAFKKAITEANILQPAFVIDVGDLIMGYSEPDLTEREWDNYLETITASQRPFVSVTGNHDVWSPESEEIWKRRIGPLYFSFNYGNSHFICLNSEESEVLAQGDTGVMSTEQIDWLKADLEANKGAENIFVFQHKPFFLAEVYPDGNWPEVHNILKDYPVRVVFVGHWHEYRKCDTQDGIKYVITGGGGAELGGPAELGNFHHYLLVNVEGSSVNWAVIRQGSVLPEEVVTADLVRKANAARESIVFSPAFTPYTDTVLPEKFTVTAANPTDRDIKTEAKWDIPAGGAWEIAPLEATFEIPAGGKQSVEFKMKVDDPRRMGGPLPGIIVEVPLEEGKNPIPIRKDLAQMRYDLTIPCVRVEAPLKIDGDLSDWKGSRGVWSAHGEAQEDWHPSDISGTVRLMWDDKWLYFGAGIWDDVFVGPESLEELFEGDSVSIVVAGYEMAFAQVGEKAMAVRLSETDPLGAIEGSLTKVSRKPGCTIYESAIPLTQVFKQLPQRGEVATRDCGTYWHDRDADEGMESNWVPCRVQFQ